MAQIGNIPARCRGICPLETIDEKLLADITFSRNCTGPDTVEDHNYDYEYDIDSASSVTKITVGSKKIGALACTNRGAGIYLEFKFNNESR